MLLDFYFGSIEDSKRLLLEKEMLNDPEVILDYFDLKRALESSPMVPQEPSVFLKNKIMAKIPRRKIWNYTLALTAAAVVLACFYFLIKSQDETKLAVSTEMVLFDSSRELSAATDVL